MYKGVCGKLFLILFILFGLKVLIHSQSQDFKTGYNLSSCIGEIPKEFKVSSLEKIKTDIESSEISKSFHEQFRFSQHKILFGGKVLFGDEMSTYVNKVAHNLLDKSGNSKLKDELRFYVLKTDVVNAICMPDGAIFITVGLLSQIENEAQLAYIISHEITHYTKQHSVNDYYKNKKLIKEYKNEGLTYKEAIKTLSSYSKENELESDKEGLVMFKKAGYDSKEAINSLIVLQYSHLPFDEIKFNVNFFDREKYTIPKEYFNTEKRTKSIEDNSGKDDMYSTHPNIKNRVDNIDGGNSSSGVTEYFSKEEFSYINLKARFENQYLHLLDKNFIKAIYESYLLKREHPENRYLDECIAKGLYGLSKFKTNSSFFSDYKERFYGGTSAENNLEGESIVLYELFEKMDEIEMNILALKLMNELDGDGNQVFVEDLMYDLIKENDFDFNNFHNQKKTDSISSKKHMKFEEIDSLEYLKLTKVEKIKYSLKKKKHYDKIQKQTSNNGEKEGLLDEVDKNNQYYLSAFINELEDTSFDKLTQKVLTDSTYRYYSDWYDDLSYQKKRSLSRKKKNKNYRKQKLNIDSLIIVEPSYYKVDGRKKYKMYIKKSLYNKKQWKNSLAQSSKKFNKNVINLAYTDSDTITISKLNTQFILKEWHNEMIENSSYNMLPLSQERTNRLLDSLGYNNIMISGVISERVKSNPSALYGMIIYPLAPLFLGRYLQPKYETYKYISILDKNGYLVLSKYLYTKKKANIYKDRLFIDDIMNQISKKK